MTDINGFRGDGDFPGGPLDLAFDFETKDDAVASLSIEPV